MRSDNHSPSQRFFILIALFTLFSVLLSACFPLAGSLPAPIAGPKGSGFIAPDVQSTARGFLAAWQNDNYADMYAALTQVSRDAITLEDFEKTYRSAAVNLAMQKMDFDVLSALTSEQSAQVSYRITYHTALIGDLQREMVMNLSLEKGDWRVQWDSGMIMPELKGGNYLWASYKIPARGDIYDRTGKAITAQADAVALAVEPAKLVKDQEQDMLVLLSNLTGQTPESIQQLYSGSTAKYVPIGEAPSQEVKNNYDQLSAIQGLVMNTFKSRYYFDGGVAPQTVGYVLSITPEQLEEYRRNGYSGDEKVGASGLEQWGESYLAGKRGATVYVMNPENKVVTLLSNTDPQPARFIYTTLDKDLQLQAQKALEGFKGAIVVLERDTGRVLAMVSSPSFDPNWFEPGNTNSEALNGILNDGQQRLLNRAAQGAYPLGSVSKIITMAAALESGEFTAQSSYNCGYTFTELPGVTLYDWTYTFNTAASGEVNLPEGLMVSCNPWFWHIGLTFYQEKHADLVPKMARAFGLGSKTGIEQIPEADGQFPDPQNEGDAVQEAIGQGSMLVTPLQVADFIAAIGNGGTLYKPQLVEKIASADGDALESFKPVVRGKLPVKPENLAIIQDAMRAVVEDRRGTAFYAFTGIQVPVYGKTGTAQNAGDQPHAWFAGYTDAGRSDRPDIAAVVLAENSGEGSMVAAPIFRRIVEVYFSGKPMKLYPWESSFYVVPTAVPTPTDIPTPAPTPTAGPTSTIPPTATPTRDISPTPVKTSTPETTPTP